MATEIKMVSKNPVFSPYAIDEPDKPFPSDLSSKGVENPAYVNCEPAEKANLDPSPHYEEPGALKRHKPNALYDFVEPQQTSKRHQESDSELYGSAKRDARMNCIILFVILFISIIALLLVIFIILGILGPSCTCSSKSTVTSPNNVASQSSVNPLYDEMAELRKNLSTLSTRMTQEMRTLQNKLDAAEQRIEFLKTNVSITTTSLQQQYTVVNTKAMENANDITSLKNGLTTVWLQANTTRDKLDAHVNEYNALKAQLENYTTVLRTADHSLTTFVENINDTLTAKIDAVSKMPGPPGPQGPPGINGTQGIQGPPGIDGTPGSPGVSGTNGSTGPQGAPGATGEPGPRGFNGSAGPVGQKGDQGAGNLTQCVVTRKASAPIAAAASSSKSVSVTEQTGKKILHTSCSSNKADTVEQDVGVNGSGEKAFSCICSGLGSHNNFPAGDMICYITYTECPLIS